MLIGGVSWILYQQVNRNTEVAPVTNLTEDTFVIPHPSASECIKLVATFLETGSPEQLKNRVRLKHLDAEQGYAALTELRREMGEMDRMDWAGAEETNGLSLEMVMVSYKSGKYASLSSPTMPRVTGKWIWNPSSDTALVLGIK